MSSQHSHTTHSHETREACHAHTHDRHEHEHTHGHGHVHTPPKDFQKAFILGIILNLGFVIIEALYGFFAHSLALLADASHNLSDVLSLILAWGAMVLSKRLPSLRHTYGLKRSSIFAALINAIILLLAVGGIGWEAILRLKEPPTVDSGLVIWVAGAGILINGFTAWLFASEHRDINIRGAYLHMLLDATISLGVVISGILIYFWQLDWIDPLISLIVVIIIALGSWNLFRESLHLAFDAVPENINPSEVSQYLKSLPGVVAVHDLHIWAMSSYETALTVHLVKPDAQIDDALLATIKKDLLQHFSISHITVQFEKGDEKHPCAQAPDDVI